MLLLLVLSADCHSPNKPCYLCKQPGHTTNECPHRAKPTSGAAAAVAPSDAPLQHLLVDREQVGRTEEDGMRGGG